MFKAFSGIVYVLLGGAFVGYLVKQVIPEFITGTSVTENIYTYILPFAIFISIIALAFMLIIRRKPKEPKQ